MVQTISAAYLYKEQIESYSKELEKLKRKQNLLGWFRLGLFIITAIVVYQVFLFSIAIGIITLLFFAGLFLYIISQDTDNNRKIALIKNIIRINEEELLILNEQYTDRFDGQSYTPQVHDYANDLDIFGHSSLYQYINRCESEQGRALLAHDFLYSISKEEILERQEAVKELSPEFEWRQRLTAYLMETPVTLKSQQRIETWFQEEEHLFTKDTWKWFIPLYSVFSISIALATVLGLINLTIFALFFFLFFLFSGNYSKKAHKTYTLLSGITKETNALHNVISWIEKKDFRSALLLRLKESIKTDDISASMQIRKLNNILSKFDLRLNWLAFLFLNSFLLWDVRQVRALNLWKQKNRQKAGSWFEMIAQFEVISSFSSLYFNNPQWCWPVFEPFFILRGKAIGHPLIPAAKRVTSDFSMEGYPDISIITGSNMAGKSTFLRSLGVNIILSQMGAPVCALHFTLSQVRLMSSMRIEDNLAESTSTFYAELKKLKTIVDAVKKREPLFILLDEILRGTNSLDRHEGSKALIRQIIKENGVAVIATHDVELAHLKESYKEDIENYHFDVKVKGEELYFDYVLKDGICTNLNATILMKKIGIEL